MTEAAGSEPERQRLDRVFATGETALFYLSGLGLLLAAGAVLVAAVLELASMWTTDTAQLARLALVALNRILLALILLELAHSVRLMLRRHRLSAEPFLLIGLIAVVREIVVLIGEVESRGGAPTRFSVQFGVLGAVVVALALGIVLLRWAPRAAPDAGAERG